MGAMSAATASDHPQCAATMPLYGIDLGRPGKQLGFAGLTHSDNVHDGGVIPVPLAVISSGAGPTALLVGGTHGDEYEGQVILHELIRSLEPGDLTGTVIVLPAANAPAVRSGTRVSPIDGGNLNRSYPGEPRSGPTAAIAGLISGTLLPRADVVLDLHSGGSISTYVPCTFLYRGPDDYTWQRKVDAATVMGLPYVMVVESRFESGSLSTAGDDAGVLTLAAELGGGATVDPSILATARQGVRSVLAQQGILAMSCATVGRSRSGEQSGTTGVCEPRWLEFVTESPVMSLSSGILEPLVSLGQRVAAGQTVARVHAIDDLAQAPQEYTARVDGVVAVLRRPALVSPGTYLLYVAPEIETPRH